MLKRLRYGSARNASGANVCAVIENLAVPIHFSEILLAPSVPY